MALVAIVVFMSSPFHLLSLLLCPVAVVIAVIVSVLACSGSDACVACFLSNCCVEPTAGKDDASNKEEEWERLWSLSEACVKDGRFP